MREDPTSPTVPRWSRPYTRWGGRRTTLLRMTMLIPGVAVFAAARADEPAPVPDKRAPFGLTWGMSSAEVKALGVVLTEITGHMQYGRSFTASNLERVPGDVDAVVLTFGFRDRLVRINALGQAEEGDPRGDRLLQRYNELRGLLADRYGAGQEVDWRDPSHWRQHDDYVMALHQGRAQRYTVFQKQTTRVELSLRAPRFGEANYVIIYEFIPGTDELEADRKQAERDAL